ncbi:hypothetical protein HD598_002341 [Neomicrococcus aestuarii]|uniref:Heavy metal transporter n=1 Tax=Neomicrococcus aestuarii TaxID=556325 RepID=A0A7W8TVH8_9MICC|nr:hypothetical protein [Neomicrococcus aestuarii]MBB5513654.1 hypothetical protein [Neomicrococcus aestuarii]
MKRKTRAATAIALSVGIVGGGIWAATAFIDQQQTLLIERCTAAVGADEHRLDPEQASNAALIAAVSIDRGLQARAATIGIATSVQESKLRNIDYGDTAGPDSRGLFQQRPSQGWGTEAQVMDPVYAANRFYQELEKFDYVTMEVTDAAQKVQRSAFPKAYADHEPEGRAYASALTGNSPAAVNCILKRTETAGDPELVISQLEEQFGDQNIQAEALGNEVHVSASNTLGWAVAQWAVANAKSQSSVAVSHSGLQWDRKAQAWKQAITEDGKVIITLARSNGEG